MMRPRFCPTPRNLVLAAAAALVSGGALPSGIHAQEEATAFDPELLHALEWRNVGPERGGRSIAVAGTPSRELEYYFGATGGGLWKTADAGNTWEPVGDGQFESPSAGAVAQCYADPDVVWVGFGEVEFRGNIIPGDGVYRSTDAGETWTHMGLESSTGQQMVGRVRIDPADCDRVYVAVLGDPFGPNEERGVFRTTDGGTTWEKVLHRNDRAGAVDLVIDPNDPRTLYAGFWEVHRKPWMLSSGGEGGGLFKSTDGGDTWTELTQNEGLPKTLWGKVAISVSGADSNRLYAIIESEEGGVFVSDDAGTTWERVSEDRNLRQRAFYYTRIYADPQDRETVYVVNVQFWRSTDGGKEWDDISVPHGDNHDLWIDPTNNQRMINANDGGANVSWNAGETWTGQDYPTAQMYDVRVTHHFPYHICGGQQDNSTACVPMDGDGSFWYSAGGCETGPVTPHPEDLDVYYAACYGGQMSFYDRSNGQQRSVNVWPINPMGNSAEDLRERFQWNHPIEVSRVDPNVVYVGSQHVWRSDNRGQSWQRISPDLTYADPETLGPSGGPITRDQTSVEYYATVWRIAPSPHSGDEIWTGSDDGRVHVTRDGGQTWDDVTPPDLPKFSRVHEIDISPHQPGKAYLAAVRYRMQDVAPHLFRTEDYGATWTKIVDGIPHGHFVRTVREDRVRQGLLYAGTERGVMVSFDDGGSWQSLNLNLPTVSVQGLVLKDDDVIIATHGRSYYVLDNVASLRQLSPEVLASETHLFQPATAVRTLSRPAEGYRRVRQFRPEIDYWLADEADEVRVEILDAAGAVIRTFSSEDDEEDEEAEEEDEEEAAEEEQEPEAEETEQADPSEEQEQSEDEEDDEEEEDEPGPPWANRDRGPSTKQGLNRFRWDRRYEGARDFEDMIMWGGNVQGPLAPPGRYQVRLTALGETLTESFEIVKDPRLTHVTQADFDAQFRLAREIVQRVDEAHAAVLTIRDVRQQVDDRLSKSEAPELAELAGSFRDDIGEVEGEIYQVRLEARQDPLNFPIKVNNQIAALRGIVESADARPTDQSQEAFSFLSEQLEGELQQLRVLLTNDLGALNEMLDQLGLDPIVVPDPDAEVVSN